MDISMIRGDTTVFNFAIVDSNGDPYSLATSEVTFSASNGTQSLTKSTVDDSITITVPENGEGSFEVAADETDTWPDYVLPLSWTLVVTNTDQTVYTVGHGVLIVNVYSEEAANG